jgi:hypothetical protein
MSTTRKIRCTDCGEAVPYGRLSCPSCGTLLASVAGGSRHAPSPSATVDTPIEGHSPAADDVTSDAAENDATVAATPALKPRPPKPTTPRPVAQRSASYRTLVPTTVVRTMTAGANAFSPATAGAAGAGTAGAAIATGGGWSRHDADPSPPSEMSATATDGTEPAADATEGPGFFAVSLDRERLDAGLEWAAALGAALVAVAMLLPWSRSVIGSDGIGYFDSWGLAGPGHVLLLVGALVVLALAVIPTSIPIWISRGIGPLVLGVFALGLTWPYVVGPLGGQVGVVMTLVGALVLIVTGVVADWHTRHARDEPPV